MDGCILHDCTLDWRLAFYEVVMGIPLALSVLIPHVNMVFVGSRATVSLLSPGTTEPSSLRHLQPESRHQDNAPSDTAFGFSRQRSICSTLLG